MAGEKLYECMFLLDSNRYAADPDGVLEEVTGMIEKAGGEIAAHRPWQEGKLAYEIEGQRKGLHYLTCFKSNSKDTISLLSRSVRLSEVVLRHMAIKHPPVLFDALVGALSGEFPEDEEGSEGEEE